MRFSAVVLALICSVGAALAKEHGITGFSGMQGETCADSCHGDEPPPVLRVRGPASVSAGAMVSWRLEVQPARSTMVGGGIDVAASAGELVPGLGLYVEEGELTHDSPQRSADGNGDTRITVADVTSVLASIAVTPVVGVCLEGDVSGDGRTDADDLQSIVSRLFESPSPLSWSFQWVAPTVPQTVRFFVAVVSANCNGTRGGDGVGTVRWEVDVVAPSQGR